MQRTALEADASHAPQCLWLSVSYLYRSHHLSCLNWLCDIISPSEL
jgi:hypothetical protein